MHASATIAEIMVKVLRPVLAAITLSCLAAGVCAADAEALSNQFNACMDKSGGVTSAMLDCIATETQQQEVRLNKAYQAAMGHLNSPRRKQLQKAQRAWLSFRQSNCRFHADPDGGTMAALTSNDCYMLATASRARELEGIKQ